jgi:hypothetical protein
MLTDQQAMEIALAYIAANDLVDDGVRVATKPEWIVRSPGVVMVGYNSAEFVATEDPMVGLLGNMPIRVDENTGTCRPLSMDEYFELYESNLPSSQQD